MCVCKIKWQAECGASTNTGASARMKGAVTTAHAGKEEKSIHPHSSLHLSSASLMVLPVNPYELYKKRKPLLFTPSTVQNISSVHLLPWSWCTYSRLSLRQNKITIQNLKSQQMYHVKTFLKNIPRTNKVN